MRRDTVQHESPRFGRSQTPGESRGTQRGPGHREPCRTTLLELVTSLHQLGLDERQVVEVARELVDSGRAVLTGNFRGCRFSVAPEAREEMARAC